MVHPTRSYFKTKTGKFQTFTNCVGISGLITETSSLGFIAEQVWEHVGWGLEGSISTDMYTGDHLTFSGKVYVRMKTKERLPTMFKDILLLYILRWFLATNNYLFPARRIRPRER